MIQILRRTIAVAIAISTIFSISYIVHLLLKPSPYSPEGILERADQMAWMSNWIGAEPLFHQAEDLFRKRGDSKHALYAEVSRIPARMEAKPLPALIVEVNRYLSLPEASDHDLRIRILTVKGMLEREYDAGLARGTWQQVEQLANQRHQIRLASRASGEQGILAFLLGDLAQASARVKKAYMTAKLLGDPAAQVRYAELIGRGIVELGRYQESLHWSEEAIKLARAHPDIALPSIAFDAKIQALAGLGRFQEAEQLNDDVLARYESRQLTEQICAQLTTRGDIYTRKGDWAAAIRSYVEAAKLGRERQHWHGVTEVNGKLAKAYEHEARFLEALKAIDVALLANQQTSDEIYFVPRNLAIKAEIEAKLGHRKQAELLYLKGSDILDGLLAHAPTPHTEQMLLTELADLYSGYFALLSSLGRYEGAFEVIEKAHGRVEAQALEYDRLELPHQLTSTEERLNRLERQLLDTDDTQKRQKLLNAMYETESEINPAVIPSATQPVSLRGLQRHLTPDELVLEYVLAEPQSYVLAVTQRSVRCYPLPSKNVVESAAKTYRSLLRRRQTDLQKGQDLFRLLLQPVAEYQDKKSLIVIPDGQLNLLPFSSLVDPSGNYVIANKLISYSPSGTVLSILRDRSQNKKAPFPYLGVAAWTQTTDTRPWVVRAITGPERSFLVPLPESKKEVETIADLMPKPATVLLGSEATKGKFQSLPLDQYEVLHLALHGYADTEFPDRSALLFAPGSGSANDSGMLKAREIRRLRLNAKLVTLSACNTGVGPVSQAGVASLSSAFIQAGAQSVVSTLWELEDRSTRQLMEVFYDRLSHQQSKAESLRQAQLTLLQSGLSPYYWASFELIGGSTDPFSLSKPESVSSQAFIARGERQ